MEKTNSIPYSPEILRVTSYHETCAEAGACLFPSALLFKEVAPVFQKKYWVSEFQRNSRLRQICFTEVPAPWCTGDPLPFGGDSSSLKANLRHSPNNSCFLTFSPGGKQGSNFPIRFRFICVSIYVYVFIFIYICMGETKTICIFVLIHQTSLLSGNIPF